MMRIEYYMNPKMDGLAGKDAAKMARYLRSIGELHLAREIANASAPKYVFDDKGRLMWNRIEESDIRAELGRL